VWALRADYPEIVSLNHIAERKITCVRSTQLVMPPDAPSSGDVRLRAFEERDVGMLMDLSTDPYVPTIGSLPGNASREDALAYIGRQINRLDTGPVTPSA
jgi:ribosomal-protein-alanine N-acetyltransferase